MDLWQMRYFIQIYNDKSLSKAAKNLYISEQGLSKAIKKIEDEFQIKLFERTSKGVIPTLYGELLLDKSQRILSDYDEMVYSLFNKIQNENKTITIGITNILHTDFLKTIICSFQEEYPGVAIEFFELGYYNCEKHLEDNLVDICFTLKPENMVKFEYIPISTFNLVLLLNKQNSLSHVPVVEIADLKDEKFIMMSADTKIRKLTIDYCLKSGFNPNIIITTSQLDFIIELIDLNKGIAILPEFNSIKALRMSNNIAVATLDDSTLKIEAGFIINRYKKLNYITKALIDYFLKYLNSEMDIKIFDL